MEKRFTALFGAVNILELAADMALGRARRRGLRGQDAGGTARIPLETARKWGRSRLDHPRITALIGAISVGWSDSGAHHAAIVTRAQR